MILQHESRLMMMGVPERDINAVTAWLMRPRAEPETMLLVRYGAPHIRITSEGRISLIKQPKWHTRT